MSYDEEYDIKSLGYDKLLNRGVNNELPLDAGSLGNYNGGITDYTEEVGSPQTFLSGGTTATIRQMAGAVFSGKTVFDNTVTGYRLGIDDDGTAKFYIGNSSSYLNWTGSALNISGSFTASTIDIGGSDATSFHVDIDGNMWLGAATFAASGAKISNTGNATLSSVSITGGSITGAITTSVGSSLDGQYMSAASIASAAVNLSLRGWSQTCAFSSTDADTVSWGAGSLILSDGTTYAIGAGNTGNMAARTYIYFDVAISTTAYQVPTTAATAVGNGKILVGTAVNATGGAIFEVFSGLGGLAINASHVIAGTITTNEIAANTITGANISTLSISGKSCLFDLGTIAAFTMSGTTLSATNLVLTSGAANVANIAVGTGANLAGLNSGNSGTDIAGWAGSTFANRATAPLRYNLQGDFFASSATITGIISGTLKPQVLSYTAGEPLVANQAVFLEDSSTEDVEFANQNVNDSTVNFGNTGSVQKVAQSFSIPGTGTFTLKAVKLAIAKVVTPVDDARCGIQADSGGAPDGSFIASASFDDNAGYAAITLNASLTAGTTYWLVLDRTGATHDTNRYSSIIATTGAVFNPSTATFSSVYYTYNGTTWSAHASNSLSFCFTLTTTQGKVYRASADAATRANNFIGFVSSSVGIGATATVQINNIFTSLTSLSVGSIYYLRNYADTGSLDRGSINTSAGSTSKKVGLATASTDLLISYTI